MISAADAAADVAVVLSVAPAYQSAATGSTVILGAGPGAPPPLWFDQLRQFMNGWAAGSTDTVIVPAAPSAPA